MSILVPVLILLMHSVTPHVHGQDMYTNPIKKETKVTNILDWLSHCFEHDLGEGHLENFITAKKQVAEFPQLLSTPPMVAGTAELNPCPGESMLEKGVIPLHFNFTNAHFFRSEIKRGPPRKV
jgi:hypothetical protein